MTTLEKNHPPPPQICTKCPNFQPSVLCECGACSHTLLGCFGFGLILMKTSSCSISPVIHWCSTSMSSLMSNINTRGKQPCGANTKEIHFLLWTVFFLWHYTSLKNLLVCMCVPPIYSKPFLSSRAPFVEQVGHSNKYKIHCWIHPTLSLGNSANSNLFCMITTTSTTDIYILGWELDSAPIVSGCN